MQAIEYIRRRIFQTTQAEMADIAGVAQATISRWETHGWPPALNHLTRIRDEAKRRNLQWEDRLFFDIPTETQG